MARLLSLFCLSLFLLPSCKSKKEKVHPREGKITECVYASGIVKSKNQYQVFSAVNGLVEEIFVTEGDIVKKGQPLLRLSGTSAQLNEENARIAAAYASTGSNAEKLGELQNNIDLAKIKMDNDAALLQRQQNLWSQQIGTQNELEQRQLAYKNSVSAYETAKLRYAELQKQLRFQEEQAQKNLQLTQAVSGDYTIRSESDGRVYSLLKEKGEMVNTQTPLALFGDTASFILELQIDEYDITRVKTGQKILLNMDSYKGQVFEARISKIDPVMNERSRSFTVEAVFVKQPASLYPNLTCEANIIISEKEKALTIPRDCLVDESYVLLENGEKRKVRTGLMDYQEVEIRSGLSPADVVLKPAP